MAIRVDTSQAPTLLRYTIVGRWPTLEEQSAVRERLLVAKHLMAHTVAIVDIRELDEAPDHLNLARAVAAGLEHGGWPRKRAFLVDGARHELLAQQMHELAPKTLRLGVFKQEKLALEWLLSAP